MFTGGSVGSTGARKVRKESTKIPNLTENESSNEKWAYHLAPNLTG